jgi:ubiquinone/menaquinone biosynthesis C-methylase UbiE
MPHHPTAAGKSSFDLIDSETFFSVLNLRDGMVILDAACGIGNYTVAIARRVSEKSIVHALDLWTEGIAQLAARAADLNLPVIRPAVCDVSRSIPLDEVSIDVCLLATVLHDLIQDGTHTGALREIKRVLKPGGRLAVVEFKKQPGPPGPPQKIRLSPEELEAVLAPMGFRCRETLEVGAAVYLSIFALGNQG